MTCMSEYYLHKYNHTNKLDRVYVPIDNMSLKMRSHHKNLSLQEPEPLEY